MLRSPVKPDRIVTPLVKLIKVPLRVPAVDDRLGFLQTNLAPNDLLHKRNELRVGGLFQERRVGSHSVERLLTLRCDAMLDIIEELIGRDISLFHSKLLMKAANDGTAIPWHQDYAYWKKESNEPSMVNCQLAIDGEDLENGCIRFVPGSHRWGLQGHEQV